MPRHLEATITEGMLPVDCGPWPWNSGSMELQDGGAGAGDGGGREREVSCVSVVNKKLPTKEPQTFHETKEVKTFSSLMAKREV